MHESILIIFGLNVTEKVGSQMIRQSKGTLFSHLA